MIYFDNAATTLQKPPEVSKAVLRAMNTMASPGRGGHLPAMRAAETVYRCRQKVAEFFEMDSPEQVVFTANATHALNIAIHTLVKPGNTVLISGYEHNAVTRPLHAIPEVTVKVAAAPLFESKMMLDAVRQQLTPEVDCVICTHASNVFGYILPIEEIAALCTEKKVPFILDASQSAGSLPVSMERLSADFIALPGHKGLFGPQGTGILLCSMEGEPLMQGGTGSNSLSQDMPLFLPDRLEAGTHNVCGIAGLLEGILYVQKRGMERILEHERELVYNVEKMFSGMEEIESYCASKPAAQSGVFSFRVRGRECEEVGELLSRQGIAVRSGFHCAPTAHQTAGTVDTGTVRVSFSPFNTRAETEQFYKSMIQILRKKK